MRTLSASVQAALASNSLGIISLVKFAFASGTVALNSSNATIIYGGDTYLGAAGLGAVAMIVDTPGTVPGLQFELQNVDSAHITLALDDADQVQGTLASIYTAVIDTSSYSVVDAVLDWQGYCDTMKISEDGTKASIALSIESKAVDLLRGHPMVYNDADQQALYPGDRGFEYVVSQSDTPVVWPTRSWFTR